MKTNLNRFKIKGLLLLLIFFIPFSNNAQEASRQGLFIGIEQFSFPGNSNEFYRSYSEEKGWIPAIGVIFSVPNIGPRHRIELGHRIRKGEVGYNAGSLGGGNNTNFNFKSNYLYLKFLAGKKIKNNLPFYFEVGPNLGFRYRARVEGLIRNYCLLPGIWSCSNDQEEIDDDGNEYFNLVEVGLTGIIGFEHKLAKNIGFFLEFNGDYSPLSGKKISVYPVFDKIIKTGIYIQLKNYKTSLQDDSF